MRLVRIEKLFDKGPFSTTETWARIESQLVGCIEALCWPPGSDKFILHDQRGKKRGEGSGVKPIKDAFMLCLGKHGWLTQHKMKIATVRRPGAIDAVCPVGEQFFALEWETGNISSSHRSLNKMALGMIKGSLVGGALVVPTRKMYSYLTDRVGNFEELQPYFDTWANISTENGILTVMAVEHDAVSKDVPRIPKGTDGRALL